MTHLIDKFTATTTATSNSFAHVLPTDVLARIAAYLLGADLLSLSHINSAAFAAFSCDELWTARMPIPSRWHSAAHPLTRKHLYLRACKSFVLRGRNKVLTSTLHQQQHTHSPFDTSVRATRRDMFGSWSKPLTLAIWFSIAPTDPLVHTGGVLLGAHAIATATASREDVVTTSELRNSAQLVYVDAQHNLYCSVLYCSQQDAPVAYALEPGRWYHLVLVYNGAFEHVYVDGALAKSRPGRLVSTWYQLSVLYIGTGVVDTRLLPTHVGDTADSSGGDDDVKNIAAATAIDSVFVCGWHAFHGVIDSCRVYRFAMSARDVQRLRVGASNAPQSSNRDDDGDLFSSFDEVEDAAFCLARVANNRSSTADSSREVLQHVWCSRPQERWCQIWTHDTCNVDDERLASLIERL